MDEKKMKLKAIKDKLKSNLVELSDSNDDEEIKVKIKKNTKTMGIIVMYEDSGKIPIDIHNYEIEKHLIADCSPGNLDYLLKYLGYVPVSSKII
jgi:hypothetical protein